MAYKGTDNKMEKEYTPPFRVSFPAVFKPESYDGGEPKYGLVALFPKGSDLSKLSALAERALRAKFGQEAKIGAGYKGPFRDGSEKPGMDGYANVTFTRITSKMRPGLVDRKTKAIVEVKVQEDQSDEQFYAGCWARATVCAYAYNKKGNKGVALGLLNVQKLKDDKTFSGIVSAADEFDEVDDGAFDDIGSEPEAGDDF